MFMGNRPQAQMCSVLLLLCLMTSGCVAYHNSHQSEGEKVSVLMLQDSAICDGGVNEYGYKTAFGELKNAAMYRLDCDKVRQRDKKLSEARGFVFAPLPFVAAIVTPWIVEGVKKAIDDEAKKYAATFEGTAEVSDFWRLTLSNCTPGVDKDQSKVRQKKTFCDLNITPKYYGLQILRTIKNKAAKQEKDAQHLLAFSSVYGIAVDDNGITRVKPLSLRTQIAKAKVADYEAKYLINTQVDVAIDSEWETATKYHFERIGALSPVRVKGYDLEKAAVIKAGDKVPDCKREEGDPPCREILASTTPAALPAVPISADVLTCSAENGACQHHCKDHPIADCLRQNYCPAEKGCIFSFVDDNDEIVSAGKMWIKFIVQENDASKIQDNLLALETFIGSIKPNVVDLSKQAVTKSKK